MIDSDSAVALPADLAALVRSEVASGRYASADELLREALRDKLSMGNGRSGTIDADVLDGIGDGFLSVDPEWRVTAFNRPAEAFFECQREDVIGRVLWEAIPDLLGTDFEARYRQPSGGPREEPFTAPAVIRSGLQVEIRAFPVPDGLGIAFRDITEYRHAVEALRTNEERLRFILDASGMGDWSWTLATDCVTLSPTAEAIFELNGPITWSELLAGRMVAEDVDTARHLVEEALECRTRFSAEYRIRRPGGGIRWIASVGRGLYGEDGAPIGMQGLVQDITDRKDAERRLRESEARLEIATRTHRIGIFDWDIRSGRIVWSDEEHRLFGLEPGGFAGTLEEWEHRVHPEDLAPIRARLAGAMQNRASSVDFKYRVVRADDEVRWIEGSGRLVYDSDGHPVQMIGVNMDVTELHRHIADLERADRHMRLLVNELNHRVKNTLAAVQSIAGQTLRCASNMDEALDALSSRLVALARAHDVLTRENWEGADLADVVRGAVAPFTANRFNIEGPTVRLPPKLAVSLAMAFHELCTNAVKYGALSNEKGRIDVRWSVEAVDRNQLRLHLEWHERDGPPVRVPGQRGFGTRMIEKGLSFDTEGRVELRFDPDGVVCRISTLLPTEIIMPPRPPPAW